MSKYFCRMEAPIGKDPHRADTVVFAAGAGLGNQSAR